MAQITKSSIDIILELENKLNKINNQIDKDIENCEVNLNHFLELKRYDRVIVFHSELQIFKELKGFIQTLK